MVNLFQAPSLEQIPFRTEKQKTSLKSKIFIRQTPYNQPLTNKSNLFRQKR